MHCFNVQLHKARKSLDLDGTLEFDATSVILEWALMVLFYICNALGQNFRLLSYPEIVIRGQNP